MAGRLILAPSVAAVAALAFSASCAAQALTDPTRPPLELMTASTTGAAPPAPLQSILLSSTRKGAIINGQYVALGGNYGKSSLIKITPTEVTLKSDQGLEVLKLYPPMEEASAVSGAERKPEKMVKRP
jgi:hypothetical protein